MKQFKIAIGVLVSSSCFITLLLYCWNRSTLTRYNVPHVEMRYAFIVEDRPMVHIPFNKIYPKNSNNLNESLEVELEEERARYMHMIDTPGCQIPMSVIDYEKYLKKHKHNKTCGKRLIFMKKIGRDKVEAMVKIKRDNNTFECCYSFIDRSWGSTKQANIRYSKCTRFRDKSIITLQTDFLHVKCINKANKVKDRKEFYEDVYGFAKGLNVTRKNNDEKDDNCTVKFNVLMIGMDSMSVPRAHKTLPRVVKFFKENFWLSFPGHHKVADNTFPNLMAALTGKDLNTLEKKCTNRMDECKKYIIWDSFKMAGYVTAYGEDYLSLPDTFSNNFSFKMPPTDHYMRPLFETETLRSKPLVCTGKISSGQQLLNYALDFAETYVGEQFFGLFWMNSFSHNANSRPQDADTIIENFLNQLTYTGVLENTFVIFFSDHGIRFGEHRLKVESYYDERLPMFFMWTPVKFHLRNPFKLRALILNQIRLMTPYDVYHTLVHVLDISTCNNRSNVVLEACPKCHSLFEVVSENRTCQDAGIHDKWCSCHKLYPLPVHDLEGEKSVHLAASTIINRAKATQTKPCWQCKELLLKDIIRTHFYYNHDRENIIYVVAFSMKPSNISYEASVLLKNGKRELVGGISVIGIYKSLGTCVVKRGDRWYCMCEKQTKC